MASIPKVMKGVQIEKTGGIDVLQYKEDIPIPELRDGEVLVKNEYVGINYIDTYYRTGIYKPPSFPYILGREGSGVIVDVGANTPSDLQPGTRVAYLAEKAYAEYTSASSACTVPLPDSISSETGAAALLQALTALTLIREAHAVQRGDWILVTAAAGGVGLWLVQLLKAIGARVIATASTAEKRELARQNGAEVLLEYHEDDRAKFTKEVRAATGGDGVAAVFDGVGKATFDACLATVRRKGTMVSFGNASGAVEGFNIARLADQNVKLLRPKLFNYIATRDEMLPYANELWSLIAAKDGGGGMNVKIHDVYQLQDVARATRDIEGRGTTGKLLLRP